MRPRPTVFVDARQRQPQQHRAHPLAGVGRAAAAILRVAGDAGELVVERAEPGGAVGGRRDDPVLAKQRTAVEEALALVVIQPRQRLRERLATAAGDGAIAHRRGREYRRARQQRDGHRD